MRATTPIARRRRAKASRRTCAVPSCVRRAPKRVLRAADQVKTIGHPPNGVFQSGYGPFTPPICSRFVRKDSPATGPCASDPLRREPSLEVHFDAEHGAPAEDIEQRPIGVCRSDEAGVNGNTRRGPIQQILDVQEHLPVGAFDIPRVGEV
jgi:hypothetical protein